MMAFATRKHLSLLNQLQNLWWKPRPGIVGYANYYKFHSGSKFFTFHFSLFTLKVTPWL